MLTAVGLRSRASSWIAAASTDMEAKPSRTRQSASYSGGNVDADGCGSAESCVELDRRRLVPTGRPKPDTPDATERQLQRGNVDADRL